MILRMFWEVLVFLQKKRNIWKGFQKEGLKIDPNAVDGSTSSKNSDDEGEDRFSNQNHDAISGSLAKSLCSVDQKFVDFPGRAVILLFLPHTNGCLQGGAAEIIPTLFNNHTFFKGDLNLVLRTVFELKSADLRQLFKSSPSIGQAESVSSKAYALYILSSMYKTPTERCFSGSDDFVRLTS